MERSVIELLFLRIIKIELAFRSEPWSFADMHRAQIDENFARYQKQNPALWNGQVLLLRDPLVSESDFRGTCFPVNYASVLTWRESGFPGSAKLNVACAALRSADGAFLLGVMAEHTSNPGMLQSPSGLPDLSDVRGSHVDLQANLLRELAEETGILSHEVSPEAHWHTSINGPRIGHYKVLNSAHDADTLRNQILKNLNDDPKSEFIDIQIVRSESDLGSNIHPSSAAFIKLSFRRAHRSA